MKLLMSVPTSTTSERPYTILKRTYWGDFTIRNDKGNVITVLGWRFANSRRMLTQLQKHGYILKGNDRVHPSYLYKKKSFLNNFK